MGRGGEWVVWICFCVKIALELSNMETTRSKCAALDFKRSFDSEAFGAGLVFLSTGDIISQWPSWQELQSWPWGVGACVSWQARSLDDSDETEQQSPEGATVSFTGSFIGHDSAEGDTQHSQSAGNALDTIKSEKATAAMALMAADSRAIRSM